MSSPAALPGFEPTQHYQHHARVALPPGSRVGAFEIVRVLGVGGFSIVYLARDLALSRLVALKEYLPSALAVRGEGPRVELRTSSNAQTFEQGLDSFINEARMLARFDHPSLVRVHHFWKANGTAYMAMRYLEGVTLLAARRAMPRPPDEAWLRALLGSLLGAIEALHAESCFHRDISPDNILLLPDGTPVLLDFGAARNIVGDGPQQLTAILKPGFAPIEQYAEATDLRQGPWTDLYALGAVMRNCITARPPIPSTVRAVGDRLPSLALEVRTLGASFAGLQYSPGLLAAIDWALALRPADRPQSVAQFRQALALHAATPVKAPPRAADDKPAEPAAPGPIGAAALGASLARLRGAAATLAHTRGAQAALARARGAVASLAALWPTDPAAAAERKAAAEDQASTQPLTTEPVHRTLPPARGSSLWLPTRAGLRRTAPLGVAAVLLGAVASVGWRSFEERQVGREVAVMASSAAAAAEQVATPVAFAAPQAMPESEPITGATLQAAARQPQDDLPLVVMSMRDDATAGSDPEADIITEPRETAVSDEPEAQPLPSPGQRMNAVMDRGAGALAAVTSAGRTEPDSRRAAGTHRQRSVAGAGSRGESPREACARQDRYTDYVCMRRLCEKSPFRGHEQCTSLHQKGWWSFIRLP